MVYALPLEMYNYSMMGYDMEAFRRLGLSEEDVPTTWDELLDLLIALPDYMANDEGCEHVRAVCHAGRRPEHPVLHDLG